jgi:hypothetical protein
LVSPPHRQRCVLLGIVVQLVVWFVGVIGPGFGGLLVVRPALVEKRDSLLDALEGLDDLPLEPDEYPDRVFVGAATNVVRVVLGLPNDSPTLHLGQLRETPLVDQEGRLLLGPGDDPLGLLLGLLDDALALGIDPFRGADLFGHGDAELVDEAEGRCLVDDDIARQGQLPTVGDDRFEALDKEDDVD